jgi:hypothetical protein
MEIAFESLALRKLCEDALHADAILGPKAADSLRRRVADLKASTSILDLLTGRPRQRDENMEIELSDGYVIVLVPNHPKKPTSQNGQVHWNKVSRVKVVEIAQREAA